LIDIINDMKKNNFKKYLIVIAVLAAALLGWKAYAYFTAPPGELDAFARCISDSGAKFYGASWCPHCQTQKDLFGKSAKLMPYVECSLPGGQGMSYLCRNAKIEGYPTWVFADGSRVSGSQTLEYLAEKTACTIK